MDAGEDIPVRFWIYPILLSLLACLFVLYRKNRILMFCALFFMIHLIMTLNIVPMGRYAMIADRYLYISGIGIFLFIAYFINKLFTNHHKLSNKKKIFHHLCNAVFVLPWRIYF